MCKKLVTGEVMPGASFSVKSTMSSVRLKPGGDGGSGRGDHATGAAVSDRLRHHGALALLHLQWLRGDVTKFGAWQIFPVRAEVGFFIAYVLVSTVIALACTAGIYEFHRVFKIGANFKRPRPIG